MPFVDYYITYQKKTTFDKKEKSFCACEKESNQTYAKVENNGDAYLKALIKRVCDQKEKEKPVVPLVQIPVFVQQLTTDPASIYKCPSINFPERISTFIIQPDITSYITDIFHPPSMV